MIKYFYKLSSRDFQWSQSLWTTPKVHFRSLNLASVCSPLLFNNFKPLAALSANIIAIIGDNIITREHSMINHPAAEKINSAAVIKTFRITSFLSVRWFAKWLEPAWKRGSLLAASDIIRDEISLRWKTNFSVLYKRQSIMIREQHLEVSQVV